MDRYTHLGIVDLAAGLKGLPALRGEQAAEQIKLAMGAGG